MQLFNVYTLVIVQLIAVASMDSNATEPETPPRRTQQPKPRARVLTLPPMSTDLHTLAPPPPPPPQQPQQIRPRSPPAPPPAHVPHSHGYLDFDFDYTPSTILGTLLGTIGSLGSLSPASMSLGGLDFGLIAICSTFVLIICCLTVVMCIKLPGP